MQVNNLFLIVDDIPGAVLIAPYILNFSSALDTRNTIISSF